MAPTTDGINGPLIPPSTIKAITMAGNPNMPIRVTNIHKRTMATKCLSELFQLLFNGHDTSLLYMGALGQSKQHFLYSEVPSNYGFFLHTLEWAFTLLHQYQKTNLGSSAHIRLSAIHYSQRNNAITDLLSTFSSSTKKANITIAPDSDGNLQIINLTELKIESMSEAVVYMERVMEFQNLGEYETQRTEHTFYYINLYRNNKCDDLNNTKFALSGTEKIEGKSRLCMIDMGLGEKNSKGDSTLITMPKISTLLQHLFQGQRTVAVKYSLFTDLLLESIGSSKNKSSVMLTAFSPDDRVNETANIFPLFYKLLKATSSRKAGGGWKNKPDNNETSNIPHPPSGSLIPDYLSYSEQSTAETAIFMGTSSEGTSVATPTSKQPQIRKKVYGEPVEIDCCRVSKQSPIPPPPPTVPLFERRGSIDSKTSSQRHTSKKVLLENVKCNEIIDSQKHQMILKWVESQNEGKDEAMIFENDYAQINKKSRLNRKSDCGIQCDDNEIDYELMRHWTAARHLDDITEVEEETSMRSSGFGKLTIINNHQREALADKLTFREDLCNIDKILSPAKMLNKKKYLHDENGFCLLSLEDLSANVTEHSEDDFDCESIPDDDLEKAKVASMTSLKSHKFIMKMEESKLYHNTIAEEIKPTSNNIPEDPSLTMTSTTNSDSYIPNDMDIFRRASLLEQYAATKLDLLLQKEDIENQKKSAISRKLRSVISLENLLKCCDRTGTTSADLSLASNEDGMFCYDSSVVTNESCLKNQANKIVNKDSLNGNTGSLKLKGKSSPKALRCCIKGQGDSDSNLSASKCQISDSNSTKDQMPSLANSQMTREDVQQIKDQLNNYERKKNNSFGVSRGHSSLPVTPIRQLSLQSPLKRLEEAERKIRGQGGATTSTFNQHNNLGSFSSSSGTLPTRLPKAITPTRRNNLKVVQSSKSSNLPIYISSAAVAARLPPSPYAKRTNAKMVDYNNSSTLSSGHGSDETGSYGYVGTTTLNNNNGKPFTPASQLVKGLEVKKAKNRESFSASSGYESADYIRYSKISKEKVINGKVNDEKISELKTEQEVLRNELREAQDRIHMGTEDEEETSLNDERRFENVDKDTVMETLQAESTILKKRIIACRNHVMMVTSFL
uniref:Kinesin motor domain-containing protein n=1 Tax=Rhabditophanes sp. KR3021 TaxID=114890 RepID=A0AC35TR71_9BILA